MHVVVVGAGAIGSFVAARLALNGGDVTLIARGERLGWLRRNSAEIAGSDGTESVQVPTADWAELSRRADIAFLCTKTTDLPEALRALAPHLAPDGIAVTLQNGVEAPGDAALALPGRVIVAGRVHGFFEMDGHQVRHIGVPPSFALGCIGHRDPAAEGAITAILEQAGIRHEITPDIVTTLWEKLILAASLGGLAAARNVPAGKVCQTAEGESALRKAMLEVAALAHASGAMLGNKDVEATIDFVRGFPQDATTSLQRDLQDGKPSEYDALVGAVIRLARANAVPIPVFSGIDRAIRLRYPAANLVQ
jgi:2-dehydropantoate 2-reductase